MKNYSAGTFLYGIPSSEVSASYHPEDQRVFLYDGYNTADGYGILIGWEDGKLVHSTGFGNFCWGGYVRLATDDEIRRFINQIQYYDGINYRR
jgi:hypothetical protein